MQQMIEFRRRLGNNFLPARIEADNRWSFRASSSLVELRIAISGLLPVDGVGKWTGRNFSAEKTRGNSSA